MNGGILICKNSVNTDEIALALSHIQSTIDNSRIYIGHWKELLDEKGLKNSSESLNRAEASAKELMEELSSLMDIITEETQRNDRIQITKLS
ncbi:hypothetical protein [Thalassobacillus hwangdonensis]|uniref:Uncharacterized protein n=1 Tax=Thalassobacillus hwangdonensis TaxID=546108 RepID=A0ABW3KXJ4_9BACI